MKTKICGITRLSDARAAVLAGADMLGLNFYPPSPRYIQPEDAALIGAALRSEFGDGCPVLVGVFVNADAPAINRVMSQVGLDFAQLSGDEPAEMLADLQGRAFKSIRPADLAEALSAAALFTSQLAIDDRAPALLIDAYHAKLYGGTGEQANVNLAQTVSERVPRLLLAGGLNADNVADRIRVVHPWGVDVASGVEVPGQPGIKSEERMRAFIRAAHAVNGE